MNAQQRAVARLVALTLGVGLGAGCSLPPSGCNLSIAAVEDPSNIKVGDALPADTPVLIRPEDVDPLGGSVVNDANGPSIVIKVRPDGAERMAIHTRTHIGEALVVSIAGTVIAVPIVMSSIEDGAIQLSGPSDDADWLARFEGCLPTVIIPAN